MCEVQPDEILLNASLGPLARERTEPEPDLLRTWPAPGPPCKALQKRVGSASRSGGSGASGSQVRRCLGKQGPINPTTTNLITRALNIKLFVFVGYGTLG